MTRRAEHSIRLVVRLSDLEPNEPDDDEDDLESEVEVCVEPIGTTLMRLLEPCSITPFGSLGPSFNLGDLIEVKPLEDGGHRFVRVVEPGIVWERVFTGERSRATTESVSVLLDEVVRSGGMWERSAGGLTVQVPRSASERDCPAPIEDLFRRLEAALSDAA